MVGEETPLQQAGPSVSDTEKGLLALISLAPSTFLAKLLPQPSRSRRRMCDVASASGFYRNSDHLPAAVLPRQPEIAGVQTIDILPAFSSFDMVFQ